MLEDLVLRRVMGATKESAYGKLGANWVEPYKIVRVVGNGSYEIETMGQKQVPRPWNVANLRKFYF